MALIVKKELENGIILENSYHKIQEVIATKDVLEFRVAIYKDKEAREQEKKIIEFKIYNCIHNTTVSSKNSIEQAYQYLKTLIEYENSIDDFEVI